MSKKKHEVVLTVDVQRALDLFPFIQHENVTLLEREEKGHVYSLCDGASGSGKWSCFWDRHPIDGPIFKCPVRKIYKGESKTYRSNINGNTYTMTDNLNTTDAYYETDGHFCSVNCALAFLEGEQHNPLYTGSKQLILAALGKEPKPAPSWRLLTVYGGTLSILEFRNSFTHKEYVLEELSSGSLPFIWRFRESYHL